MDVSAATKNTDYDHLTLETIKQLAAQETPPSERPDTLLLKNIRTAPSVFQRRRPGRYEEERVVSDIIRDLKADPPRLPGPILVTSVGRHFFVVDGHHRLEAYRAVTWKHPIPVKHFTGPLKDAWRQSLRSNVLNKIHMSQEEKSEAAFQAYIAGQRDPEWGLSWQEIANDAHIDKRTVGRMAKAVKQLGLDAVEGMTWKRVRLKLREQEHEALDDGERNQWKIEKARKLADYLTKGPSLTKDPEITAMALEMVSTLLPGALVSEWHQEAKDAVLASARVFAPDRAAAIEEALEAADEL